MKLGADPELSALFAEPMHEVRGDERALQALLAQLERTDRRRGFVLAGAGVVGASLAASVIAATNATSSSIAEMSTLSMHVMTAIARLLMDRAGPWSVPDGSLTIAFGIVVLAGAATAAFKWRGFGS